jgi:hypothetical protein
MKEKAMPRQVLNPFTIRRKPEAPYAVYTTHGYEYRVLKTMHAPELERVNGNAEWVVQVVRRFDDHKSIKTLKRADVERFLLLEATAEWQRQYGIAVRIIP